MGQHSVPSSKFKNFYKFFKFGCYFTNFLNDKLIKKPCGSSETPLLYYVHLFESNPPLTNVIESQMFCQTNSKLLLGFRRDPFLVQFLIYVNSVD